MQMNTTELGDFVMQSDGASIALFMMPGRRGQCANPEDFSIRDTAFVVPYVSKALAIDKSWGAPGWHDNISWFKVWLLKKVLWNDQQKNTQVYFNDNAWTFAL